MWRIQFEENRSVEDAQRERRLGRSQFLKGYVQFVTDNGATLIYLSYAQTVFFKELCHRKVKLSLVLLCDESLYRVNYSHN
jgi:hypothetical protein